MVNNGTFTSNILALIENIFVNRRDDIKSGNYIIIQQVFQYIGSLKFALENEEVTINKLEYHLRGTKDALNFERKILVEKITKILDTYDTLEESFFETLREWIIEYRSYHTKVIKLIFDSYLCDFGSDGG